MTTKRKNIIIAAASAAAVLILGAALLYTVSFGGEAAVSDGQSNISLSSQGNTVNVTSTQISYRIDEDNPTVITLNNNASTISGTGAAVEGNTVTISKGGTYTVSGSLDEGQIYVNAGSDDTVVLVLAGVSITNSTDAAVYAENADALCIVLQENTDNVLQSGAAVEITSDVAVSEDASGAALYSRDDLVISGAGSLTVLGYINNGIHTTNDLVIESGNISVTAVNNGIKGKDSVTISGGTFDILSANDGIKSDDTDDTSHGWITITDGSFTIKSLRDGIQAETTLNISGGEFNIESGDESTTAEAVFGSGWVGGSGWDMSNTSAESTKGIKCGGDMTVTGGSFTVNSYDDSIHSNGTITITDGTFTLSSGDDGIHADVSLDISGGSITITKSYEGLEANQITISGGDISITASDDGINANGGPSGFGGMMRGDQSDSTDSDTEMPNLYITGGSIYMDADGDGLDSNGNIYIEGGTVIVDGPTTSANGAIDSGSENGGECIVNGGTVIAVGASGMAEAFSSDSGQCSFMYNTSTFEAGTVITISDSSGNVLFEHTTAKSGSSIVFSCPDLTVGETYTIAVGEDTGEITLESVSTTYGSGGGMMDSGNMHGGGHGGGMGGNGGMGGFPGGGQRQ